MLNRYVFCQFCDDVRREIDGKYTLIGVYEGGLQVKGALPAKLPKLVIVCHAATPVDKPFTSLRLRIEFAGKPLLSLEAPEGALSADALRGAKSEYGYLLGLVVPLQPFEIGESGDLRVFVDTDAETLVGNRLQISIAADESGGEKHVADT